MVSLTLINYIYIRRYSAQNWPVYAGIPYWNFLFVPDSIPALTNINYIHLYF
jgi:hypothetical protein